MKTGAYWFKFLTEKEKAEFKVNCGNLNHVMKLEFESFYNFILFTFSWDETPQGYIYWMKISQRQSRISG